MLFSIAPGIVNTWVGLGVFFDHATLGPIFRVLRLSPGGRLIIQHCFIKRLVGVSYEDGIRNAQSLARPAAFPGNQTVQIVGPVTLLTSEPTPRLVNQTAWMIDYAGSTPPDTTLASQGLYFGGYDLWVSDSYFINEYFANSTCLTTRPGSECLALLMNEVEADRARQAAAAQQQIAAGSGGSSDGDIITIVVAVVVPVGTVLLAALVGSIWWVRRSSRRQLEKQQRAKADAAKAAADVEAGGSQQKTGSRGARLGVLAGGVQNNGGGVFLGVDDEKDLPEWSEGAHNESDDVGMEQPAAGPTVGFGGNGGPGADSTVTGTAIEATGTSSIAEQLPLQQQSGSIKSGAGAQQPGQPQAAAMADAVQQGGPAGLQANTQGGKHADAPAQTGGDRSMHDRSQRASRATNARLKPALTQALADSAVPAPATAGPEGQADKQELTEYALSGSRGGHVEVKVPDQAPSADQVVAELGALVKELRSNVNHVAIVLEGVLGHGSFGTVYKGTWQGLPVAIKTVVFSANQESRKHALKEAALCQSISHPNVIATYASELQPIGALPSATMPDATLDDTPPSSGARAPLNITDWRLYIIQEFADGGPLGNLYGHRALWLSPGVVNLAAVVPLALGIARALAHLHSKRIVHGDLNPNNVLLKRDPAEPSGYAVKVGDFGLSVMLPSDRTHLSNIRMGTMFYICPAVACKGQVGPAADVFSLGVLLWELYHGRRAGIRTQEGPRYCSNFPAFPPTCPEIYKAATLQCLQRQPQNRPPATTVVAALENLVANLDPAQSVWLAAAAASVADAGVPAPNIA
ncbi:hypothetical protein HYH02_009721 [Chlamydomonas schloesseri]|uniref:Protein kinase domain-containing protein n=1 Tax=Chlamydomonas schloesseri TaxID=2026947 RepID=A0A835TB41_9CHLO|nr:hypothetical protein HYH02_009721 [Chlamydomonas schloesseri]|eukprot:KAG2442237.1 hypothetical protein HYH02_009721 [Chlamydomonas schloesseri]